MRTLLVVMMMVGLVGCESRSLISDSRLTRIRALSFVDGYFAGHQDASDGVKIDAVLANSKGDAYSRLGEVKR